MVSEDLQIFSIFCWCIYVCGGCAFVYTLTCIRGHTCINMWRQRLVQVKFLDPSLSNILIHETESITLTQSSGILVQPTRLFQKPHFHLSITTRITGRQPNLQAFMWMQQILTLVFTVMWQVLFQLRHISIPEIQISITSFCYLVSFGKCLAMKLSLVLNPLCS